MPPENLSIITLLKKSFTTVRRLPIYYIVWLLVLIVETRNLNGTFANFLSRGNLSNASSIYPDTFFKSICSVNQKYGSFSQQDGPELFRYFVDALIEGERKVMNKDKPKSATKTVLNYNPIETPTETIFGHYQVTRVDCLHCNYISWSYHMSRDINLDIEKDREISKEWLLPKKKAAKTYVLEREKDMKQNHVQSGHFELQGQFIDFKEDPIPYFDQSKDKAYVPFMSITDRPSEKEDDVRLETLLDNYFKRELLNSVENYYTCYNCRKLKGEPKADEPRFITKTNFLYHSGPVIGIALKRFKKSTSSYWSWSSGFSKIDTTVPFPAVLDLSKYFIKVNSTQHSYKYALYAIVVHSGGLGGGHYVSYSKHNIGGKDRWFYASDSHVSEVNEARALEAQAYMLFYRKI